MTGPTVDLSFERWKAVTSRERESIARRLALELPSGFGFDSLRSFRLGAIENEVALFSFESSKFALIPGGRFVIGNDIERKWVPTAEELESWQTTAAEYDIGKTIHEYVAEITFRPREIELAPFLMETDSQEMGWEKLSLDDDEVKRILREHDIQRSIEVCHGGESTRIRKATDGALIAERSLARTHGDLADLLRVRGFRFPTSGEWEYACGCGAPTLFRWGDHVPCDRYPTDISPKEAAWRRKWVLSGGKLEYPPQGFAPDWDQHLRPNAFGLFIASNPCKFELVNEIGMTRGGDGGCTICGGAGFFIGWLTLATAYFEEHACKHDPAEPVLHGYTVGRRVLGLDVGGTL